MEAPSRARRPRRRCERFREQFDAKYPKAVAKLDRDWAHLTAFYDFPAEHWRHLRTTNAIESSFATVKLRTRVTKGAGSKKAALAMAYKLLDAAQERWRRFNGHELVADVLAGATFKDGIRVTDDDNHDDRREGRRLISVRPRSTTFDNCSSRRSWGRSLGERTPFWLEAEFPRYCGVLSTCGESAAGRMDSNAEDTACLSGAVPAGGVGTGPSGPLDPGRGGVAGRLAADAA